MLDMKALINKLLEAVSVDYVVEEGASGIWTYRKWNSGIAECWGITTGTTISKFGSIVGWFEQSFPITFTNEPVITATARVESDAFCHVCFVDTTEVYVLSPAHTSAGSAFKVRQYVVGRWK